MKYIDHKARIVAELRKRAAACETITYGELSRLVGLAAPLTAMLDEINADERAEGRPDLACLVVSAATGMPGHVKIKAEEAEAIAERRRVFEANTRP